MEQKLIDVSQSEVATLHQLLQQANVLERNELQTKMNELVSKCPSLSSLLTTSQ